EWAALILSILPFIETYESLGIEIISTVSLSLSAFINISVSVLVPVSSPVESTPARRNKVSLLEDTLLPMGLVTPSSLKKPTIRNPAAKTITKSKNIIADFKNFIILSFILSPKLIIHPKVKIILHFF